MRDMVPQGERSIRNIPVPPGHRRIPAEAPIQQQEEMPEQQTPPPSRRRRTGGRRRPFILILIGVVLLCGIAGILLSTLFAGATVTVYPRTATVTPPASLVAQPNAPAGTLSYQTITLTQSATTTVSASGTHTVTRAASGTLTIFNAYSTASQRLIANTRFAAPDGKIYRIHDSVTVPGATAATGGTLTPGSTSATVYADAAGPDYNRGTTRFTIPGFKGDPRYDGFYATADSIAGGFSGTEPAISQADLTATQKTLEQALQASLGPALTAQIPDGYVAIPGTLNIIYGDIVQGAASGSSAPISKTGSATGVIVRTADLASAIAKQSVSGYAGEAVRFADVQQLQVTASTTGKNVGPVTLNLGGEVSLVWNYDIGALRDALVGKNKASFEEIIKSFQPAITRAEAKIRPFWASAFPTNPEKITVTEGEQK